MSLFVELKQSNGVPVSISIDSIACFVPATQGGCEVHLTGGRQILANKATTWSYLVTESYDEVKEAIIQAEVEIGKEMFDRMGFEVYGANCECGCEAAAEDWDEEPAIPNNWKPDLKIAEKSVPASKAKPKDKDKSEDVDWDDFKEPPHGKEDE